MANMSGRNRFAFDAALELNDGGTAITVDGYVNAAGLSLNQLNAFWNGTAGEVPEQMFALVVDVLEIDVADTDETYALQLRTGDVAAMTQAVTQQTQAVAATGQYVFYVDPRQCRAIDADAEYVNVFVDVGGTTPSIKARVYAAPILHASH